MGRQQTQRLLEMRLLVEVVPQRTVESIEHQVAVVFIRLQGDSVEVHGEVFDAAHAVLFQNLLAEHQVIRMIGVVRHRPVGLLGRNVVRELEC